MSETSDKGIGRPPFRVPYGTRQVHTEDDKGYLDKRIRARGPESRVYLI
jgi:hypothetical protein